MNAFEIPLALIAFLGIVMVIPVWMWFKSTYQPDLPMETAFIAGMVLPATVALFIAGWLSPGG